MRIVFDGRWIGRTGIGRYAEELLNELQKLDTTNEYLVLLLPKTYDSWKPSAPNFKPVRTTYEVYTWQEQLLLGAQIHRLKPDLVHFTSFNLPVFYPGRFITTIHDLTLVHFKNVRGGGLRRFIYEVKYWVMRGIMRTVTRRAERIIAPCEFTKNDIINQYHLPANKILVTYEAVGATYDHPEPLPFPLPKQFVMYLGNMYPYKNIERLIDAYSKTQARKTGTKLILAGRTPYFEDLRKQQVERLGLTEDVIFAGQVSDNEAATLYQNATVFAFPSLYEGFGLMGLEAMTQGTPVLAANASCLPEIYADAAEYCNPHDTNDITAKLDALLADPKRRQALTEAGYERAKLYSWTKMAQETLALYRTT
jgi:glycosyltransferase involved in cell wall biosynthesis